MSNPIRLVDAFQFWQGLPHQLAAAQWLDDHLTDEQRQGFGELFRAAPAPKPQASPSPGVDWLTPCRSLVQQFEGCRLVAYPDPGTGGDPWTIGWGHTGPEVKQGVTWTQGQADQTLANDLVIARSAMIRQLPMAPQWPAAAQAALTSFVFNVGEGALADSTLRRRIVAGEDAARVVREELPRWNKGGNGPLPGLARRRAAEIELFCGGPAGAATAPATRPRAITNPLAVPYFPQLDNGPEGWRQCQTSSLAMCLAFLGTPGIKDDTDYLAIVQRYGDTTDQAAHQKALASLNVRARFRQDMSASELLGELKAGLPVAIGILHHGPVTAPTGGGHYIVVIGFTETGWIVHDPYGELDLINGSWVHQDTTSGKAQTYSMRNLNPRWLPGGPGSGWGWVFS